MQMKVPEQHCFIRPVSADPIYYWEYIYIYLHESDLIEALVSCYTLCLSGLCHSGQGIYKWVWNVVQAPENKPPSYLLPLWYIKFAVLILCDYVQQWWPLETTILKCNEEMFDHWPTMKTWHNSCSPFMEFVKFSWQPLTLTLLKVCNGKDYC